MAQRLFGVVVTLALAMVMAIPAHARTSKKYQKQQITVECFTDEDRRGARMVCGTPQAVAVYRAAKPRPKPQPAVEFVATPAGGLVAEARRYIGMTAAQAGVHRRTLWCSAFMRKIAGTPKGVDDWARSWLSQRRVAGHVGAIVIVQSRRMHVGVVSGFTPGGDPIIVSGNHNNRVREAVYPRSSVIAYVSPS